MRDIENNFRFLLLEVSKQLESTLAVLEDPDEVAIERIESRDDYIDNLKSLIGNLCYAKILNDQTVNQRMVNQMRSINIMATNLERLADHAVNIVRQIRYFKDPGFLKNYEYYSSFEEITGGLDLIYGSVFNRDLSGAFAICRVEAKLDRFYKERFDRIVDEMRGCQDPGDLITALFIFRYLERTGDALLNIGEAAIYGITGERLKIRQYNALRESLVAAGQEKSILDVRFSSIWGTRSGARIGRIAQPGQTGELFPDVIFKEGNRKKLLAECANIALWEEIWPGLAPRVVSQQTDGKGVTLLFGMPGRDHLPGVGAVRGRRHFARSPVPPGSDREPDMGAHQKAPRGQGQVHDPVPQAPHGSLSAAPRLRPAGPRFLRPPDQHGGRASKGLRGHRGKPERRLHGLHPWRLQHQQFDLQPQDPGSSLHRPASVQ